MNRRIVAITLVVRDYEETLRFYRDKLDFEVLENRTIPAEGKRWITIRAPHDGVVLVLGKARGAEQHSAVGHQTGGRVAFFLSTSEFESDHQTLVDRGVNFVREPKREDYGVVAVFEDLYGNLWDLVEFVDDHPLAAIGSSRFDLDTGARGGGRSDGRRGP